MREDVLQDCRVLFELMRRFWSSFGHQMSNVIAQSGINVPQYVAMVALSELREATMGQLAKRLRVTMGASTNIVDRLVRAGYVMRTRDTRDRRVVRVKLEPKGSKALREIEDSATSLMAGVMAEVDPERRRQFIEQYTRMVEVAESRETAALKGANAR